MFLRITAYGVIGSVALHAYFQFVLNAPLPVLSLWRYYLVLILGMPGAIVLATCYQLIVPRIVLLKPGIVQVQSGGAFGQIKATRIVSWRFFQLANEHSDCVLCLRFTARRSSRIRRWILGISPKVALLELDELLMEMQATHPTMTFDGHMHVSDG